MIMTTLTTVRGQALRRFLRHYLEMIIAMAVGMVVWGPRKPCCSTESAGRKRLPHLSSMC
jgi:hypothetical protein